MAEEINVTKVAKYDFGGALVELGGSYCIITDAIGDVVGLSPDEAKKIAYYILQYYGPHRELDAFEKKKTNGI